MSNENKDTGIAIFKGIISKPAKTTKENIKKLVLAGDADSAYVGVMLKKFHKIAEEIKKDKEVQSIIEEEIKNYRNGNDKTFSVHGAKVTVTNRGYLDLSTTEDPYLAKLQEIEKEMKELIKLRKDELEIKANVWEKQNTPTGDQPFKNTNFSLSWDKLPRLEWDEGYGEIETNAPIKRSNEILAFRV